MQKYFKEEESRIFSKYALEEGRLHGLKVDDCDKIRAQMTPGRREADLRDKFGIGVVICSIIAAIATASDFGTGLVFACIFSAIGVLAVNAYYKNRVKEKRDNMEAALKERENKYAQELAYNDSLKEQERRDLATRINKKMNAYAQTYTKSTYINFIVEWLLNAFSIQIEKADRSAWLPQVKAGIHYSVTNEKVQVPGYGDYDMAGQGIVIDNDPIAISALAYVIEKTLVSQAQVRFKRDKNGGTSVITSSWDKNTSVDVNYSAPNGNVKTVS